MYTLNLRLDGGLRARAAALGVPIREYEVIHELLTDLLHQAGLPGPARELAAMRAADAGTGVSNVHQTPETRDVTDGYSDEK